MPENAEQLGRRVTVIALAIVGIVAWSLSLLQYVPVALLTYVSVISATLSSRRAGPRFSGRMVETFARRDDRRIAARR